jgi:hypothetical protein
MSIIVSEEHVAFIIRVEKLARRQPDSACYLLHAGSLLGLFFDPEDGGGVFFRNVGSFSTDYSALYPRR